MPIIVRSLAESFATLDEDQLPIGMNRDFMLTLDSDLAEQNSHCRRVDKYENNWWIRSKQKDLDSVKVMDRSSMDRCLETHFEQLFGARQTPFDIAAMPLGPYSIQLESSSESQSKCRNCVRYKDILSSTLHDVLEIHNFANTTMTSTEAQWNITMRRASTFNLLHEAVVIKETDLDSSADAAHRGKNVIKMVAKTAKDNLLRLQSLPPTSHKWTWGETLTKGEVLNLGRSGTRPTKKMHSGYDVSLADDRPADDDSFPSMPRSVEGREEVIPTPSLDIPDYTLPPIHYFEKKQFLNYDPLGKRQITAIITSGNPRQIHKQADLASLTSENLLIHTEYAELPSDEAEDPADAVQVSSAHPPAVSADIAARWEPASEDEDIQNPPAGSADIAARWESASEDDDIQDPPAGSADIAARWESASEDDIQEASGGTAEDVSDRAESEKNVSSSHVSANSQLVASHSQITLNPLPSFPWSDAGPIIDFDQDSNASPISMLETPAPEPYRRFGPDDFNFLQEHMFDDKMSDSESEFEE